MFRSFMLLGLAAFLVSTLAGCIVVDGRHGKLFPPGQIKKGHDNGQSKRHGKWHD